MWRTLRELIPDAKKNNVNLSATDGGDAESIKRKAECFKNFFAQVGRRLWKISEKSG